MKIRFILVIFLMVATVACKQNETKPSGPQEVEINAFDYAFAAPDTIASGWTRFKMTNMGKEEHFMLVNPLPEGVTKKDVLGVVDILQNLHDKHDSEEINKSQIYDTLAKYLGERDKKVGYKGGPGFLSMGHSTEATTFLEPGKYLIECYMRTPEGIQHNKLGMMRELVVVDREKNKTSAPNADYEITLTNDSIQVKNVLEAGKHTFKVNFQEHPNGYIGNDVHLFKIKENTKMDEVAHWMDVFEKGGLISPAPVTFLGGTNEMPKGENAYFTLELEPGKYAWIAEQDYENKLWKEFEVK